VTTGDGAWFGAGVREITGGGVGSGSRPFNEKAIRLSALSFDVSPTLRRCAGPPAAITTYCCPSRPRYVMGVALPVASSLAAHNSLPVRESKARSFESLVAPTKTSPPAVAMVPPTFGVPVFSSPCGASSSKFPSGTFHTISPVVALTADSSPQGGCWQG